jgi:hypothetical protein
MTAVSLQGWHLERARLRRRRRLYGRIRRWGLALSVFAVLMVFAVQRSQAEEMRREYLRVTFYTLPGRMASGALVHEGAAACSAWIPFGTILELPDGRQVVCEDRGHGDWYWAGWLDVWSPSSSAGRRDVSTAYGDYAWVNVIQWGRE